MATGIDTVEIESDIPIQGSYPLMRQFLQGLSRLHIEGVPLSKFEFKQQSAATYVYTFRAADGRKWAETLTFDNPTDPTHEFKTHGFRLSEFIHHRDLRAVVIRMVNQYKLTKLEVTFG